MKNDLNRMNIHFSNDMTSFNTDFYKGFSKTEIASIIVGLIIGLSGWVLLSFVFEISSIVAIYLSLVPVIPIIFLGFYKQAGMNLKEILRKRKLLRQTGTLLWVSTETESKFEQAYSIRLNELHGAALKKAQEKDFDDYAHKMLVKLVAAILLIVVLAVVIVLLVKR